MAVSGALAQTKFSEARTALEKWVEARQLIAKEKADWELNKDAMQQSISLLERESKLLDEQTAKAEATSTEADKERQKLVEERESLAAASETAKILVADLEKQLLRAARAFPPPLKERIEPLFRRIPENPATARSSLGERMQNVVGILSEVDKFNSSVSVTSEVRKNPAGAEVEVKTLYLGLAVAYFADRTGKFAGYGVPGADGWQWTERSELGPKVQQAIVIYENNAKAAFVSLPVEIAKEARP
jgi:hypothetical protein